MLAQVGCDQCSVTLINGRSLSLHWSTQPYCDLLIMSRIIPGSVIMPAGSEKKCTLKHPLLLHHFTNYFIHHIKLQKKYFHINAFFWFVFFSFGLRQIYSDTEWLGVKRTEYLMAEAESEWGIHVNGEKQERNVWLFTDIAVSALPRGLSLPVLLAVCIYHFPQTISVAWGVT